MLNIFKIRSDRERQLEAFWPRLSRIASAYEAQASLQQELQQEMAIAIWQALDSFRSESSLNTFLYRIAHNVGVTHVKKQVAQVKTTDENPDDIAVSCLEKSISEQQQVALLMRAIRQLPLLQRQIITLYLDGVKQRDVAEILGMTENNIAVRISRAKSALEELMMKYQSDKSNAGAFNER